MSLLHERADTDGVLLREPITFVYAARWAAKLSYTLLSMSDQRAYYAGPRLSTRKRNAAGYYYEQEIEAQPISIRLATYHSTFTLYFRTDPFTRDVSCSVGMWGEPLPEDLFQRLLLAVRDLPYSAQASEKLIEKSDWLDLNPMYRGLPGIAGRRDQTPGMSANEEKGEA